MARFRTLILASAVLFVPFTIGRAQTSQTSVKIVPRSLTATESSGTHLRVDTSLVLVPVNAVTVAGESMTGLTAQDFHIFEDGVEQKIATFSNEDAPLSVGFVFDASGSMGNKVQTSMRAAEAFFKTSNSGDEYFLVKFGDRPKLALPFTLDFDLVIKKMSQVRPFGRTSLLDAIHLALVQMQHARNSRKAIVIFSDGGDNDSRLTRRELRGSLLESDVQLYAMGIFNHAAKQTEEEANGPHLLSEFAESTGGRCYPVEHLDDLIPISARIGKALRNQYLIGYSPTNPARDGKYRRISLKPSEPLQRSTTVSYRHGYYAPQ